MALASGVDQAFSLLGTQTNGDIFDCPAVACHSVALEMGQHQVGIIFRKVFSHQIFFQLGAAIDRQGHRAVFVQDHHISNIIEAVILRHLVVHGSLGAGTAVSRVALYNSPIHRLDHILDQLRAEVVAVGRFAGREFNGHAPGRRPAQCGVNSHQTFGGDVRCHIDRGAFVFIAGAIRQIAVENNRSLGAGKATLWIKQIPADTIYNIIGFCPIYRCFGISGNRGFVRKSLGGGSGRTSGVPPENRRHLFTGYGVLSAKPTASVAGHDAICRCPGCGIGIGRIDRDIRKAGGTLYGGASLCAVQCIRHSGAGHRRIGREGAASQNVLFPAPVRCFSVPCSIRHIGEPVGTELTVLCFRDSVKPLYTRAFRVCVDSNMGKCAVGAAAVPMLHAGRTVGHIARMQDLYRLALDLMIANAIRSD